MFIIFAIILAGALIWVSSWKITVKDEDLLKTINGNYDDL